LTKWISTDCCQCFWYTTKSDHCVPCISREQVWSMNGWDLTSHSTHYRSFQRWSSQPITWLVLVNKTKQQPNY